MLLNLWEARDMDDPPLLAADPACRSELPVLTRSGLSQLTASGRLS